MCSTRPFDWQLHGARSRPRHANQSLSPRVAVLVHGSWCVVPVVASIAGAHGAHGAHGARGAHAWQEVMIWVGDASEDDASSFSCKVQPKFGPSTGIRRCYRCRLALFCSVDLDRHNQPSGEADFSRRCPKEKQDTSISCTSTNVHEATLGMNCDLRTRHRSSGT